MRKFLPSHETAAARPRLSWPEECALAAKMLTQPERQAFLDLVLAGKSIGEARETTDLSFDAAIGVINQNIENGSHLRRTAE